MHKRISEQESRSPSLFRRAIAAMAMVAILITLPIPGYAAGNPKYASIVMDADTGLILHQSGADKVLHPASLTKMMTMLLTFEALESGNLTYDNKVRISTHAAGMIPSKLNIPVGGTIKVRDALYALATKSANDVAVALAEHIGKTESGFARMMTQRARDIGMSRTVFRNASGLHDPKQVTTARDMAKLARYILIRYPTYYSFFSKKQFTYKGATYNNHNKLLGTYPGADGFKTGYINASGFNLVASAKRDGKRLIGVVFGGRTGASRNEHMVEILDRGFEKLEEVRIAAAALVPVPGRKPVPGAAAAPSSPGYASLSALQERTSSLSVIATANAAPVAQPATIGDLAASIGQGDYESPQEIAPAAAAIPTALPSGQRWAIQIGAYSSRAHTDYSLRQALSKLPDGLNRAQPLSVPLRTADGLIYRARLTGYSKSEAVSACQFFKECLTVAP